MYSWFISNWPWFVALLSFIIAIVVGLALLRDSIKSLKLAVNLKDVQGGVACSTIAGDIVILGSKKPEWYEILEEELKRLPIGRVVFNPPDVMKVGARERVEVRISKDSNADLVTALKGRGIAQIENVKVSELMKVRLSGSDFDITQLNEEGQFIDTQGFTEWAWDIMPKKSGKRVLHLHVTLRIRLPFGEERKDHPVLDREIIVKVNPVYSIGIYVSTYLKWIATALILPLIGLIWKIYIK